MNKSEDAFHKYCREIWNSYNCPVCYHIKNPDIMKNSTCMKCDQKASLLFCIICGHLGCSNQTRSHALVHHQETKHQYVMILKTFDVWDFQKGRYVHKINADVKTLSQENKCACAVCQHKRSPKLKKQLTCMVCAENEAQNLWICLSCRHIGCGRRMKWHALEHFKDTNHPHVMQLENFSIWDYNEEKYVHKKMHGIVSLKSSIKELVSQVAKKDLLVPVAKESLSQNKLKADVNTGLSTKIENDLLKRMEHLECQCQEFGQLAEVNEKIVTIEKRLLNLTYEKKILEEKLYEHDIKLNKLLAQFTGNRRSSSPTNHLESGDLEIGPSAASRYNNLNSNRDDVKKPETRFLYNNITVEPPTVNSSDLQNEIISLMILGLFVNYFFRSSLQTVYENFMNLF